MDKTSETSTAVETGEGTDLDPAVVMAEHNGAHENYTGRVCIPCDDYWPCLPYRLAEALATAQAQVQRVETAGLAASAHGPEQKTETMTANDPADREARIRIARAAWWQKFLDEADGDPVRAEYLRKAYFSTSSPKVDNRGCGS